MQALLTPHPPIGRADILDAARVLQMAGADSGSHARLINVLCDESLGAEELASRIEAHPVLAVQVLKVANSAFYGQVRTVGTIKRALLVLGVNSVRSIAAAACLGQMVPRRDTGLLDTTAFFRHSLATALACDALARNAHPLLAPDAFIAGLIHNLGVVLQAHLDPTGTAAMIEAQRNGPVADIRALELQFSRVRHEECAAVLLDAWELPDSLVATALHHHEPAAAPTAHRMLVNLVSAGMTVASGCGFTHSLEPLAAARDSTDFAAAGLRPQHFDLVAWELPQQLQNLTQGLA